VDARTRWQVGIIGLVTLASLAWAMWGLDLRAVGAAIGAFPPARVPVVLGLYALAFVARTARFAVLIGPQDGRRVEPRRIAAVLGAGFLAINVVPLRMGELVRPYLLAQAHGVPFGAGMAAVVLERLCDMLALLVLIGLSGLVAVPGGVIVGGHDLLLAGQRAMIAGVVVGLVGVIGLAVAGPPAVARIEAITARISPSVGALVARLLGRFVDGLRGLASRPVDGALALGLTALVWTVSVTACAVILGGFELPRGVGVAVVDYSATLIAIALGPTPGFIGPFEAGAVGGLLAFGADPDAARAFALVHHALSFGFVIATGVASLVIEGWSLGEVVKASRQ
jgi:uncharacterized protein (TIRG00374 family)